MKSYLGDGLYIEDDGFQMRLYASNGVETTNEVYLDPCVLKNFIDFVASSRSLSIVITPKLPNSNLMDEMSLNNN